MLKKVCNIAGILQTALVAIERNLLGEKSHKQDLSKLFPLLPKQNNPIRFLFVESRLQQRHFRTLSSEGIQYAEGSLICDKSHTSPGSVTNPQPGTSRLKEQNFYHLDRVHGILGLMNSFNKNSSTTGI